MTTELSHPAARLRNLYFTRTVVQFLWAASIITLAAKNPAAAATLLIFYPLWDVACTIYDIRTSEASNSVATQYFNVVVGVLTTLGIALTVYSQPRYAVAIFGLWALLAGVLQLAVGLLRRQRLGGQWAMILSGLQSTAAGIAFILGGLHDKRHIQDLGGYAIFGAVYFLVAGILLHRKR